MIQDHDGGVRLHIHVQPRASKSEVVGTFGDALKVRIAAPPVDGEANAELERFIAKLLGIPRSRVSVVSGESSRRKMLHIEAITAEEVHAAFARYLH